jgi:hypothetical protein
MTPMSIRTAKLLDVPLLVAMGQATTFFPMVTFMILPMGTFFLTFGESVANQCSWCNILCKQIKSETDLTKSLNNCISFVGLLKATSNLFSKQTGFMVLTLMFASICHIYRSISFFFGSDFNDLTDWTFFVLVLGYFGAGLVLLYMLHILVNIAVQLELRLNCLIDAVVCCKPLNNESKEQALHFLKSFEGFSAMGFFHLKKSLLSSIAVNFLTYLIILMQFKVGEKEI